MIHPCGRNIVMPKPSPHLGDGGIVGEGIIMAEAIKPAPGILHASREERRAPSLFPIGCGGRRLPPLQWFFLTAEAKITEHKAM